MTPSTTLLTAAIMVSACKLPGWLARSEGVNEVMRYPAGIPPHSKSERRMTHAEALLRCVHRTRQVVSKGHTDVLVVLPYSIFPSKHPRTCEQYMNLHMR